MVVQRKDLAIDIRFKFSLNFKKLKAIPERKTEIKEFEKKEEIRRRWGRNKEFWPEYFLICTLPDKKVFKMTLRKNAIIWRMPKI